MLNRSACNVSSLLPGHSAEFASPTVRRMRAAHAHTLMRALHWKPPLCVHVHAEVFPQRLHGWPSVSDLAFDFCKCLGLLRVCAACACWRVRRSDGSGLLPSLCSAEVQLGLFTKLRSGVTRSSPSDTQVVIKVTSRFPCVSFMTA